MKLKTLAAKMALTIAAAVAAAPVQKYMKLKTLAAKMALTIAAAVAAAPVLAADWVVGANIGNVPWQFQDASGKFVGFEVDLVNEVAKRAGKSVKIENIPFNGLFPAVQSGRIQIAISSITITAKRLESLAFAQPYYDSDQSLSVLKATKIEKLEDLAGKTVGVDTASTGDIYTTENTGKYKIAKTRWQNCGGRHGIYWRHLHHRKHGQIQDCQDFPLRGPGASHARSGRWPH